jgi:hypothetical protein
MIMSKKSIFVLIHNRYENVSSRDNSVGIATGCGLDGRVSIPDGGKIFLFSTASRPALRPTQPPMQWVLRALPPGVKRQGR